MQNANQQGTEIVNVPTPRETLASMLADSRAMRLKALADGKASPKAGERGSFAGLSVLANESDWGTRATNAAELRAYLASQTPLYGERPVAFNEKSDGSGAWIAAQGFKGIGVERAEGGFDLTDVPSDAYRVYQSRAMLEPVREFVNAFAFEAGISVKAHALQSKGRFEARFMFEDASWQPTLLERYGEPFAFGLRLWNSVDRTSDAGADGVGICMRCSNLNNWGQTLGELRGSHFASIDGLTARLADFVPRIVAGIPRLAAKLEASLETALEPETVPFVLLGANVPVRCIPDMLARPAEYYVPHPGEKTPNAYGVYNMATALATHDSAIAGNLATKNRILDGANAILNVDALPALIDAGRERWAEISDRTKGLIALKAIAQ